MARQCLSRTRLCGSVLAMLALTACSHAAAAPTNAPTQVPTTFLIDLRGGQQMQATGVRIMPSYGQGIPLDNGVIVSFDYVSRVQFGNGGDEAPSVAITLVDGTVFTRTLIADSQIRLVVQRPEGDFGIAIEDVVAILLQRDLAAGPVPGTPPLGDSLGTVVLVGGETIQVSGLRFTYGCERPCGAFTCLYGERLEYLHTAEVSRLVLSDIHQIQFGEEPAEDGLLPVSITTRGGESLVYHTQPPSPCESSQWEVDAASALGSFRIGVTAVERIVFE